MLVSILQLLTLAGFVDYFPITNSLIQFDNTVQLISVPVTIFNDFFCEDDETFHISLSTFDNAVVLDRSMDSGVIIICDTDSKKFNLISTKT